MKSLGERLKTVEQHVRNEQITVMILGLGSVGAYLLDYLISLSDPAIRIVVAGRDADKMQTKVNIVRVAGLIRQLNKSQVIVEGGIDFDEIDALRVVLKKHKPDFVVNASRAYPGLKYGSISWNSIRAYGIWTPLAIRYIKNIMEACEAENSDAVVINTSYSDAVIPWLKSAGRTYPDFGSGNLNHLVPRIQFAAAEILQVPDYWNVSVMFAAGHFHDVCISKEGQTEGVELPLKVYYRGEEKKISPEEIYRFCSIPMPVDQSRNMMNASSNYQIICGIIKAIRTGDNQHLFIPGFDGQIGGYPVVVGYREGILDAWINEDVFGFDEMNLADRKSMALDGIEDIRDGKLIYTDELIEKAKKAFGVTLPKTVAFEDIEKTAGLLIDEIILPRARK